MGRKYSFLKDELAIIEIRKHKWIESEKQGQEIGFATAALDWIKQYGEAWLQARLRLNEGQLTEKRRYRRFNHKFPVEITVKNQHIIAETKEISLVGISCAVPDFIPADAATDITIEFPAKSKNPAKPKFKFQSRISRVSKPAPAKAKTSYDIFVPFSEEVRDYIRSRSELVSN